MKRENASFLLGGIFLGFILGTLFAHSFLGSRAPVAPQGGMAAPVNPSDPMGSGAMAGGGAPPMGGGGGAPGGDQMMQQVQQLQAQMEKAQEELAKETVEASAGGGMVTVKATGALQITEIKISAEAIDPDDPEMLADMVLAAVNEALRSAQSLQQSKLGGVAGLGDLGLPGM